MKVKDAFKLLHTMDGTPDMSIKEAAKKLQLVSKHLVHIAKLYEHGVSTRDDIVLDQLDDAAMCIIAILSYYRDIDSYSEDKHDKCADCDDPECDGCEYDHDCDSCPYDDDATWVPTEKGRKIIEAMKREKGFEPEPMKEMSVGVTPIPCMKNMPQTTVKDWFAKADEELNEWKEAVLGCVRLDDDISYINNHTYAKARIAEEAADVATVLASANERGGIDAGLRNKMQQKVNDHNKERGRW